MLQKKPHYLQCLSNYFSDGPRIALWPSGESLGPVFLTHPLESSWTLSSCCQSKPLCISGWAFILPMALQTQLKISIWWLWWNPADSLLGRQLGKEIKKTNSKGHEGRLGHRKPGRVTVSYLLLVLFFWDPALRGVCTLILEKHPVVHCTLFQTTGDGSWRECSDLFNIPLCLD